MATYNFLDKTGLGLVWQKVKALIPTKTSDLTNDSGFITSASVPTPSSATPSADGTGSAGSSTNYARADHVHPKITQAISMSSNVITLTGSDGTTSSVTLPVYDGTVLVGGAS